LTQAGTKSGKEADTLQELARQKLEAAKQIAKENG
jgi:hypothetical protein